MITVVLPEPFAPSSPKISPGATLKLTRSTARQGHKRIFQLWIRRLDSLHDQSLQSRFHAPQSLVRRRIVDVDAVALTHWLHLRESFAQSPERHQGRGRTHQNLDAWRPTPNLVRGAGRQNLPRVQQRYPVEAARFLHVGRRDQRGDPSVSDQLA